MGIGPFINVSHTPYMYSVNIILYNINFGHEAKCMLNLQKAKVSDVEFSICGIMSVIKKFSCLGAFRFFRLGMLNLYSLRESLVLVCFLLLKNFLNL